MSEPQRETDDRGRGRSRSKGSAAGRKRATAQKRDRGAAKAEARTEPATTATGKRRGRPPGSVSLTPEIQDTIVNYTRGGAMAQVAAEAAGIEERTYREWMQRGEGRHPTRPSSLKLRRFAREVRKAQAEARVAAEIRVMKEDVKFWLRHVARSRPGREGWTEPSLDDGREGASTFDAKAVLAARLDGRAATKEEELEERDRGSEEQPEERPRLRVVGEDAKPRRGGGRRRAS